MLARPGMVLRVFIDASLIRVILVPGMRTLIDDWNWCPPRFAGGLA